MLLCEAFNQLPYSGALFDQPYPALLRMEKILHARSAVEEAESKTADSKAEAEKRVTEKYGSKSA